MIYWCVLLVLVIYAVVHVRKNYGPHNDFTQLVHGTKDESVETLLQRLDYANNMNGKIHFRAWILLQSIVVTFFLSYYVYNSFCGVQTFLVIVILVMVVLLGTHTFYEHHINRFNHYFTDQNIKNIRKKLRLKTVQLIPNTISPFDHTCDYYRYK